MTAAGTHVAVIAAVWSLGMLPAVTAPTVLTAQLIVPEAPPAPLVEPPRPKPVVQPPEPAVKPKPVPRPAPPVVQREPERLAAKATEPVPSSEATVPEPPAPAPPTPPVAAAPAAPAPPAPAAPAPVVAPRFDADYLDNPAPNYPALARRMGEEGKVLLRVFVEPDGRPSQVLVKEGSGSPRLDRAAEEAVARWKFVPARRGAETVGAWVLVPIVFSLRG